MRKRALSKSRSVPVKDFRGQTIDPLVIFQNGIPQPEPFKQLLDLYGLHTWVYAAVFAIASNFASVDYDLYETQKDGELLPINPNDPFAKALENPNPYMTMYDVKEWTAIALEMTGNGYWALERSASGEIAEIWPLPPHLVKAVSSSTKMIDHYLYEVNSKQIRYDADDMIHFQYTNPNSFIYGQGSVEAATTAITTDLFAEKWNKNFFKNSARPDAVLQTETSLDTATRKRVIDSWRQMHAGVANARKTAILESGLKYVPIEHTHSDMEFGEQGKNLREKILSVFGTPPAIVGVFEYANYANVKEQTKMFWMHTLLPKIRKFEATLSMRGRQITFRPNLKAKANLGSVEALRTDELQRSIVAKNYVTIGIPTNQVIDALELPFDHIEGGDISHPSLNQNPTTQTLATTPQKKSADSPSEKKDVSALRISNWKRFDREISSRIQKMQISLRSFFRGQKSRVKDAIIKKADALLAGKVEKANNPSVNISLIFDDDNERAGMKRAVYKHIKGTLFEFAVSTARKIDPEFDFDLQDPKALAWLEAKAIKLVREANNYTKETISENIVDAVEEALAEGFSRSETIAQITARIDDVYEFAMEGRSERIARTEIISASNKGSYDGMKATGVEKKEWLSSKDDKVRETHQDMDGQTVKIDESFISPDGATLEYPGDPSAPAEEVINCRCTVLPIVGED